MADLNEGGDDHLDRLVDDSEAVGVVQAHDVGAHEGKDGHDVQQHFFLVNEQPSKIWMSNQPVFVATTGDQTKKAGSDIAHGKDGGGSAQQQEGVVMSLRHIRCSDALNH